MKKIIFILISFVFTLFAFPVYANFLVIDQDMGTNVYSFNGSADSNYLAWVQTFTAPSDDVAMYQFYGQSIDQAGVSGHPYVTLCKGTFDNTTTTNAYFSDPYPTYGRQPKCKLGDVSVDRTGGGSYFWWSEYPTYNNWTPDLKWQTRDVENDGEYGVKTLTPGDDYYILGTTDRTTSDDYNMWYSNTSTYSGGVGYFLDLDADSIISTGGDWMFRLWTTGATTPNITLTYPVPFSASQILIDSPIEYYDLEVYGTCKTNGSDRIYVHTEASSYVPTSTDFTSQGIDCADNVWSASIAGLNEGLNDLTFWSYDFISNGYSPVYQYDYVDTQVLLYANQSFDPGFYTTTTTSTIDATELPFIGGNLDFITDTFLNKIPIGYFWQVYQLYDTATTTGTSTAISIDFSFGNKFPALAGLQWNIVDLADPYNGLSATTTAQLENVVDWINYVLYMIAAWWFLDWIIKAYTKFVNQ